MAHEAIAVRGRGGRGGGPGGFQPLGRRTMTGTHLLRMIRRAWPEAGGSYPGWRVLPDGVVVAALGGFDLRDVARWVTGHAVSDAGADCQ